MAVALILDFPEGTMEQYHQVVEKMDLNGELAEGGVFHAAGIYEGNLRVVDVWDDVEKFERFRDEKIIPFTQEVGVNPPSVRTVAVAERKPGSGGEPKFLQVVRLPGIDEDSFQAADEKILGSDHKPPEAVTFHVNGPDDGGDRCVIDAWESKEARDRFFEERVKPAMADAPLSGEPVMEDLEGQATLRERASTTA